MAKRQSCQKLPLAEKPIMAPAVMATLTAVTLPEPKRRVSLSLRRLETIEPMVIIMDSSPAKDKGTDSSPYTLGQAAPRTESGRPRLINER